MLRNSYIHVKKSAQVPFHSETVELLVELVEGIKVKTPPPLTKFLFIAALLQIVWGLVPSASKFVIDEIPVELYIAIRWTISGFIFAIYLIMKKNWSKVSLQDIAQVSALGILGYGVASVGTLYGLKIGGVTNFALMASLSPIITTIIAVWLLKERPQKLFLLALPLVVVGLLLLVVGKYQVSSLAVAGTSSLLIMVAYVLEAIVFVFSKRFKSKMNIAQYLAISQIAAALFMWLLQAAYFQQSDQIHNLSLKGFVAAAFVSVVACVLCYAVLYWLLNYVDGHKLALFDVFHTLSAVLFGSLFFAEELRPLMIAGGALILLGLIIGNWPKRTV